MFNFITETKYKQFYPVATQFFFTPDIHNISKTLNSCQGQGCSFRELKH